MYRGLNNKILGHVLLVATLLFMTQVGATKVFFCNRVFESNSIYTKDFVPLMRSRLGGSEKAWNQFVEKTLLKSPEEIAKIHEVLRHTKAQSWFKRTGNSLFFYRIQQVFKTLDNLHVENIDLMTLKNWSKLKVHERRALLLLSFKKWWWEVDSPQLSGFTRWASPSFLIGQLLTAPLPTANLRHRLDELLGGEYNVSMWESLFTRFAGELSTLGKVGNDKKSRDLLVSTLVGRALFLKNFLRSNQGKINRFQYRLTEIYLLKTEVLIKTVEMRRMLTRAEVTELAEFHGFRESAVGVTSFRQAVFSNSPIYIRSIASAASFMAVSLIIGHFYFQNVNDSRVIVPLNEIMGPVESD